MKFDLHVHSQHSPDSRSGVKAIIDRAKACGLDGVSITDHNSFNGSEEALMLGRSDILIIPGAEYSTDQGHLLVYFLRRGLEHLKLSRDPQGRFCWQDIVEAAHDQNGAVFMAHPFKSKHRHTPEIWSQIDGIEIYNGRTALSRNMDANFQALQASRQHRKAFSAGSDAHWLGEIGHAFWECPISQSSNADHMLSHVRLSLLKGTGKVWGSPCHRLYEPASQILKSFKTSSYPKALKPLAKLAYCCALEGGRCLGFGKQAYEGWVEIENEKGEQ